MAGTEPGDWWERLPAGIREQVDGHVLQDSVMSAVAAGGELAARLSVPFHFASPDTPDDEAPRWR